MAKLFGNLAANPQHLGMSDDTITQLMAPACPPTGGSRDVVLKTETAFSLGFWKPTPNFAFGSPKAFGAPGAGGAFAFADPAFVLGFAYTPNRMGTALWDDRREVALRQSALRCVGSLG